MSKGVIYTSNKAAKTRIRIDIKIRFAESRITFSKFLVPNFSLITAAEIIPPAIAAIK